MCVTTQMELSVIIEKNTNQNVSSIWISKDGETRDKIAVVCHYVLYAFALYVYNPAQTQQWKYSHYRIFIQLELY